MDPMGIWRLDLQGGSSTVYLEILPKSTAEIWVLKTPSVSWSLGKIHVHSLLIWGDSPTILNKPQIN